MNVARAKLDLIKPEEVSMDEYEVSGGVLTSSLIKYVSSFPKPEEICHLMLEFRIVLFKLGQIF